MKTTAKLFLLLIALTALVWTLNAQPYGGRWIVLGTAHVDGGADHDNIRVGYSRGPLRAVQLRVRGSAIEFQRVIAHFANGPDQELQFRDRIPPGGATRPLDLAGGRRILRSVEIFYGRGNWGRRQPSVVLYGLR